MRNLRSNAQTAGRLEWAYLVRAIAEPSAVVVVGASADPLTASGRPLDYLRRLGFGRPVRVVSVVNPRYQSVAGYPCMARIEDIPGGRIDVAIVYLAADSVTAARRDLDQLSVWSAAVIGNGFKLSHSAARQDLVQFLGSPGRGLRLVGPNCVQPTSPVSDAHLNSYGVLQTTPARAGGAALVTQSGATGNGILVSLLHRGGVFANLTPSS
jgi:acyl-CoA synthetase (NDP forming)